MHFAKKNSYSCLLKSVSFYLPWRPGTQIKFICYFVWCEDIMKDIIMIEKFPSGIHYQGKHMGNKNQPLLVYLYTSGRRPVPRHIFNIHHTIFLVLGLGGGYSASNRSPLCVANSICCG